MAVISCWFDKNRTFFTMVFGPLKIYLSFFGQNFGQKFFMLETIQFVQKWFWTKSNFWSHLCQKNDQAFWPLIFLTNFGPKIFFGPNSFLNKLDGFQYKKILSKILSKNWWVNFQRSKNYSKECSIFVKPTWNESHCYT